MNNGLYFELFAIKDGVRYDLKQMNAEDVGGMIVDSVMNALDKIIGFDEPKKDGEQA